MTDPAAAMTFVWAAYAAAVLIVAALIAWVVADGRMQVRRLAELEAQGIGRRAVQQDVERS